MTGYTGEGLAVARIFHLFPDGMGKLTLGLMTPHTDRIGVSLEHPSKGGTMPFMTIHALSPGRMDIKALPFLHQGLPVATNTQPVR